MTSFRLIRRNRRSGGDERVFPAPAASAGASQVDQASTVLGEDAASPLHQWVERRSGWFLWCFLAAHLVVWTIVPAVLNPNLPLDVIEALGWGHEWEWGYTKHPPLSGWMAEIAAVLGNRSDAALYLLSQLCVVGAIWSVWKLASQFATPIQSLIAALLMEGILYHNYTSPEFNVNVMQLPLWGAGYYLFWRGIQQNLLRHWLLLGIVLGLAGLAKYLAVFMVLPMAFLLLVNAEVRQQWKRLGVYVTAATALLVLAPHLQWLIEHDFQTFRYGMDRAEGETDSWANHVMYPLEFLSAQALIALPLLILLAAVWPWMRPRRWTELSVQTLWLFALGPLAGMLLVSMLFGFHLRSMWGTPMLVALPALVAVHLDASQWERRHFRRFAIACGLLFLLPVHLFAIEAVTTSQLTEKPRRTEFPGRAFAARIAWDWASRYGGPLPFVIGHQWYAGNVAWYAPERPSLVIQVEQGYCSQVDVPQIAESGAAVIWHLGLEGTPPEQWKKFPLARLREMFPNLQVDTPILLDLPTRQDLPDLLIGRAWIPPQKHGVKATVIPPSLK